MIAALVYVKINNLARWCGKQVHVTWMSSVFHQSVPLWSPYDQRLPDKVVRFCYKKEYKILISDSWENWLIWFFFLKILKNYNKHLPDNIEAKSYHREINLFIKLQCLTFCLWPVLEYSLPGTKNDPSPISGMERDIGEIPAAIPIFSITPESAVTMPTLPDIGTLRKIKMTGRINNFWTYTKR